MGGEKKGLRKEAIKGKSNRSLSSVYKAAASSLSSYFIRLLFNDVSCIFRLISSWVLSFLCIFCAFRVVLYSERQKTSVFPFCSIISHIQRNTQISRPLIHTQVGFVINQMLSPNILTRLSVFCLHYLSSSWRYLQSHIRSLVVVTAFVL